MSGRGETRELLGTVSDLLSQHGITIRPETLEQVEEALENRGSGSRTAQRRRTSPIATTRRSSASPSRSHTSYAPDPPNPLTHPPPLVQDEPLFAGPSETTPQSFRYNYNLTPQTAAPPIAGLSASRAGGAESPNEESFGTLVLSQSGRSTYLGPTAGPEWLRNVSTKREQQVHPYRLARHLRVGGSRVVGLCSHSSGLHGRRQEKQHG
jgi:hypothetical protein